MKPETTFYTPYGSIELHRDPSSQNSQLRAWDAADEYLLSHVDGNQLLDSAKHILVFNDGFGALSLGLSKSPTLTDAKITVVSDSVITHAAIQANAERNALDQQHLHIKNSFEFSALAAELAYDLVIVKVPKSLSQLEDNLRRIRSKVSINTPLIAAGMVKNVHSSTMQLFETTIGETTSSLAKKKARLIFSSASSETDNVMPQPAEVFSASAQTCKTEQDVLLASYPGIFCHGNLATPPETSSFSLR